jgi:hypothetical protein
MKELIPRIEEIFQWLPLTDILLDAIEAGLDQYHE